MDIKELTIEEIISRIREEKENYNLLKMSHVISPIENPLQLRSKRKVIARLYTELTNKLKVSQ